MNNLVKLVKLVSIMLISFSVVSCVSSHVYGESKAKAIQAIKKDDMQGVGVDLSMWRVLKEQPFKQFGAAVLDAGLLWGGYKVIEEIGEMNNSNNDSSVNISGEGNTYTETNIEIGDGNTYNESQETDTEETDTEETDTEETE